MHSIRVAALALLTLLAAPALAGPSEDFAALLEEHWEWYLAANPVSASSLGDRRYNDRWSDQSLREIERRQQQTREFLRRVYAIDRTAMTDEEQLNHELFRRALQDAVDQFPFNGHLMPLHHRGGVQTLDNTTNSIPLETLEDYEDWLARMGQIDVVIDQTIELAERGRKSGMMPPGILMQRIPNQIAAQLVDDAEASPFFRAFVDLPDEFSQQDQVRLRAAARSTVNETILPAYHKLDRYFSETYLPASRDSIGLSELPGGSGWYELRARSYTTRLGMANEAGLTAASP